ncbi:hypothetical protein [Alteriqipengyuania lutimaris]|nr:hypothetical protein [Alteriqipengyuania lutimaris]MBB3034354.1 hypothetical protein [Alteriqipengyuania lutimaris]
MKHQSVRPLAIFATCAALTACSPPDDSMEIGEPEAQQTFGAEAKRIAGKLSLGSSGDQTELADVNRALACSLALESLSGRLMQGGGLAPEVIQAFNQAREIYTTRANVGLSAAEAEEARTAAEEVMPEESDRARLAIGCLRDLT